ncbi:ATP-dependent exoDNAse (exonuclease V) beta subunit (contains helicase and exonuclease domains) [Nannocystis exedens]|uniref:DNA 3'-5' helicase n=1 Tax=Nannocystis exedens TaxID=54 RepID=A0A1I1WXH9_9BACT|nr:UvrD-helicase domain-containing protein [Nannocystis exedens]PCC70936.1 UvrD/REP helicase [Nannocystis exedens]SFD99826.1 ATP-dependent exoDNAse (exonuclease V) beta subunit (contains helicase and exonuclease domains) [Nannocystis exedens]
MSDPEKPPRPESLWLFGEPEAAAAPPPPVRKARRNRPAPRQVARPARDLFNAVAGAFARSAEAAARPAPQPPEPAPEPRKRGRKGDGERPVPADRQARATDTQSGERPVPLDRQARAADPQGGERHVPKDRQARATDTQAGGERPVPADRKPPAARRSRGAKAEQPAGVGAREAPDDRRAPEGTAAHEPAAPVPEDIPPADLEWSRLAPTDPEPGEPERAVALEDMRAGLGELDALDRHREASHHPGPADSLADAIALAEAVVLEPTHARKRHAPKDRSHVLEDIPPAPRQDVLAVIAEAERVAEAALDLPPDPRLAGGHRLEHMRILASAGSGKTYQLTNRYLQILSRGAFPYSILASTFTRAAAGEIRDRILRTLAEAADDDAKREELGHRLHRELARTRVLDLLASLANNLHRLQIRTLDSFFGTIVRCFSLELGLPIDARIVDEDEAFRLRREAIGLMLEEGDTEAIIELLASLTEGSSERAVTDTIDNTVSSLYDLYREARDTSAWEAIAPEPTLNEQELDDAIAALRFAVPTDLGKRGIEAHAKDCQRAEQCRKGSSDDWMEFFTTGLAKKVAENDLVYYNKPIAPGTVFAYRRLLGHARGVFRRRVIEQTRATCTLLQLFDSCYRRVKREHKVLTFADLTVALAQADLAGHLDEICFRIDARLRHVLLDEMQDTSIQQWNALRPIVDETVSYSTDERSFFCVGDVKQSIYGWRNACPEILSRLDDLLHRPGGQVLAKETLATSFRSSPAVIEVVNKIFTNLKDNPSLLRYPYAAKRWDSEFEQHTTTRKIPGYVQLRAVGRCEDQGKRQALRLQEAAALVAELYHRHPGKTIGVLLRTNGAVGRVLYELGPTRLKIPATGRGGGPLTDAPAVNAILDLLRLADHPDHSIAGFNVFASPLGQVVGFDKDDRSLQRRVAARVRRQIASDGLAPTLQQWVRAIAPQVDERQYRRCMQLIQLAQVWDERRTLRCDQFVAMVETRPVADPAASAVQVMTVHQSKGLEFDIVILPELETELASTRTLKVVYERDGDAGPVVRIARHVSKDMWQQFDDLRPIFEQHIDRLAHESLCLLYVAVTRAREGLFMLVDPPTEGSRGAPAKASALLIHALHEGPVEPDSVLFEHGDRSWLAPHAYVAPDVFDPSDPHLESSRPAASERPAREAPEAEPTSLSFLPSQGPLVRAAVLAQDPGRTVADHMHLADTPLSQWGAAMRALFGEIAWFEEFNPSTPQLEAIVRAAAPARDETWVRARVQEFLRVLEGPNLRAALSRGDRDPAASRVERQVPFARLDGGGALQTGEIARLVLEQGPNLGLDLGEVDAVGLEGHVQKATVYGLCLDNIEKQSEAEERARAYRDAVSAWRAAAAEQAGLDRKQVEVVLLFPAADVVLPV